MEIGNDVFRLNVNTDGDLSAGIVSPTITGVSLPGVNKTVSLKFEIDSAQVNDESGGSSDLVVKLRLLDYCSQDGEKGKILVLASQPFFDA